MSSCLPRQQRGFRYSRKPKLFLRDGNVLRWLGPALPEMNGTGLDGGRCFVAVGSMMSRAENSVCCYQSKS